jgi:hypothetical protein
MADPFYNRTIRKMVVGFGNLFNNITLVRYNPDQTEQERFVIPISYASRELYVKRLLEDPDLDKKVQMSLPRFSFEMNGLSYDADRKQNTNIKNYGLKNNSSINQYNPVPYNFDFSLYLYTRNIEDATQALEHILSYFTPDYTIKLNLVPEMGIIKEVPVILKDVTQDIEYEGDMSHDTRVIIWTLNFTVKGFIFGAVSPTGGIIKSSYINIIDFSPDKVVFNMDTTSENIPYKVGETVYQGYSAHVAISTGIVQAWANNVLTLTNITGNFVSTLPVTGINSAASYKILSLDDKSKVLSSILTTVIPETANINSNNYIIQTFISETG